MMPPTGKKTGVRLLPAQHEDKNLGPETRDSPPGTEIDDWSGVYARTPVVSSGYNVVARQQSSPASGCCAVADPQCHEKTARPAERKNAYA